MSGSFMPCTFGRGTGWTRLAHMVSKTSKGRCVEACEFLEAVGNPTRLLVLAHLLDGEQSVNELLEKVGSNHTQAPLSQNLAKLRRAGLVNTRRESQWIYYSCDSPAVRQLLAFLEHTFGDIRPKASSPTAHVSR
ncbi:metalloregulator ArsR/SmtB family transcription factor [Mesorhizobium sp. B2-3-12]|uniref:ArsR/SmtB family transcription factor n=1 Tax=Mesorhizobium sp. B2-3-12 TaxID=2589952 RepID=UPI0032B2733D